MAGKEKHVARSKRSRNNTLSGMYAVDRKSEFLTMQRRRIKEAKENAGTS